MAHIRNGCRRYMTNDRSWISPLRQVRWWRSARKNPGIEPYLLVVDGREIGFGIISTRWGEFWLTGGLIDEAIGKGHGRWLFAEMTRLAAARGRVFLEVFRTNTRAQDVYLSIGYRYLRWRDLGVMVMRYEPDRLP